MAPEAIHSYNQAIQIEQPNFIDAHNKLGTLYTLKQDYEMAIKMFLEAVRSNPKFQTGYVNLGIVYEILDRHLEVIEQYKNSIIKP